MDALDVLPTMPDALEWVLLVAALIGVVHHWRNLVSLAGSCHGALPWAEVIICRIYTRHERVRLGVKVSMVLIACWLISQPTPNRHDFWEDAAIVFMRVALVGIVLALDWESIKAHRDRGEISRRQRRSTDVE